MFHEKQQGAGTDVNATCRSNVGAPVNKRAAPKEAGGAVTMCARPARQHESADGVPGATYIVTADDFSLVKLFNGPVVADDAPYRAYRGHASHVTCVRFSADDRLLFSVGGHDRAVFQWRTCGVSVEDKREDEYVLKALDEAVFRKRQKERINIPHPAARADDGAWMMEATQSGVGTVYKQKPDEKQLAQEVFQRSLSQSMRQSRLNRTLSVQKSAPLRLSEDLDL
jgi:WD domain, G-beta repeat